MDSKTATCFELDTAVKDSAIAKGSEECKSLQDAFSPICSYTNCMNPCDICPMNDVSALATAEYMGKEMKCADV